MLVDVRSALYVSVRHAKSQYASERDSLSERRFAFKTVGGGGVVNTNFINV